MTTVTPVCRICNHSFQDVTYSFVPLIIQVDVFMANIGSIHNYHTWE